MRQYNFYPDDCCNFLKDNDAIILDWIDKNLDSNARILVAANELSVVPSATSTSLAGSDAGIWISQLTNRKTTMLPYYTDFLSLETTRELCQKGIDYVYVGNRETSFSIVQINNKPDWYKKVLFLQNAQLYQLITCVDPN